MWAYIWNFFESSHFDLYFMSTILQAFPKYDWLHYVLSPLLLQLFVLLFPTLANLIVSTFQFYRIYFPFPFSHFQLFPIVRCHIGLLNPLNY